MVIVIDILWNNGRCHTNPMYSKDLRSTFQSTWRPLLIKALRTKWGNVKHENNRSDTARAVRLMVIVSLAAILVKTIILRTLQIIPNTEVRIFTGITTVLFKMFTISSLIIGAVLVEADSMVIFVFCEDIESDKNIFLMRAREKRMVSSDQSLQRA
ncbi:hypothetical protein ElyMa_002404000 [Elysia marginata]|uniref:G-protein coupled receptors family 1 profile domain-containing protein n=1 Tax=Elysia marginata TaxID=1093978 RepID=A0AAV4GFX0_9GAST|nr:hypothetical protein ElyMa_002404000 [Elysia marginata]